MRSDRSLFIPLPAAAAVAGDGAARGAGEAGGAVARGRPDRLRLGSGAWPGCRRPAGPGAPSGRRSPAPRGMRRRALWSGGKSLGSSLEVSKQKFSMIIGLRSKGD